MPLRSELESEVGRSLVRHLSELQLIRAARLSTLMVNTDLCQLWDAAHPAMTRERRFAGEFKVHHILSRFLAGREFERDIDGNVLGTFGVGDAYQIELVVSVCFTGRSIAKLNRGAVVPIEDCASRPRLGLP